MTIYKTTSNDVKNTNLQLLNLQLSHFKTIYQLLENEDVKNIFKKWIGKKYTKRLQTQLQAINKHFYIDNNFSIYLEIAFYSCDERSTKINGCAVYLKHYKYGTSSIADNNNIIKENVLEIIQNTSNYYKKQYEQIKAQIENIDNIINQFNDIVKTYNDFEDNTNIYIRELFNYNLQLSR